MRYFFDAKVFLFFSMIKSEKLSKLLDYFKNSSIWVFIAKTGIFLGFGFLGIYYWFRFDDKKWYKILFWQFFIFIIGAALVLVLVSGLGLINAIIAFLIFNLFGLAGFSLYLLGAYSVKIIINYFVGKASCPGVAPVIPGVKIPGVPLFIPAIEGWLALFIILVLHEAAHGILARNIGVKVKSFGLMLIGFFPIAAFTEPDDKQLNASCAEDQLKVYAAGPMINFYLSIFVLILLFCFSFFVTSYSASVHGNIVDGVYIVEVTQYTGICGDGEKSINYGNIDSNVKIIAVNEKLINDLNDFVYMQNYLVDNNLSYGVFTLQKQDANKTVYDANIFFNKDNKFGIQVQEQIKSDVVIPFGYHAISFVTTLLYWLGMLSLMVAIFNFLPTNPFDGGKMSQLILGEFVFTRFEKEKRYKMIGFALGMFILILFVINLLPLFF